MRAIFLPMAIVGLLGGCVDDVTIYSQTTVNNYPARYSAGRERGTMIFSCTTIAALYDNLEYGSVSEGCALRPMTAPTDRGYYTTRTGQRVLVYSFVLNGWPYYAAQDRRGGHHRYGW